MLELTLLLYTINLKLDLIGNFAKSNLSRVKTLVYTFLDMCVS